MSNENLTFGKRFGFENSEIKIQINSIDHDLRTDLYNSFLIFIYNQHEDADRYSKNSYTTQHKIIWAHYLRQPLDKFPDYNFKFRDFINYQINNAVWYKTYELFEFLFKTLDGSLYQLIKFKEYVNDMLERNNSAYRVIDSIFVPITNKEEIEEMRNAKENAIKTGILGLGKHLSSAIDLLSKKPTPDFRNSIKESISMVEAVCRTIEPSQNTLGKALNKFEAKVKLNSTLKASFEKLYAYSNEKGGIRHALMDDHELDLEEARFFLISCSAFSNYLVDKGRREGLIKIDG
jgi:hypothetical protein